MITLKEPDLIVLDWPQPGWEHRLPPAVRRPSIYPSIACGKGLTRQRFCVYKRGILGAEVRKCNRKNGCTTQNGELRLAARAQV